MKAATSRRLRGWILLFLGIGVFALSFVSFGTNLPRDATWIFIPQNQVIPDYDLEGVTLRLNLNQVPYPILQVELDLSVHNKTRSYDLGIIQPLAMVEELATATNRVGNASAPLTNIISTGSYFTRSIYRFNSFGYTNIYLNVPLRDPILSWGFGKTQTV